MLLCVKWSFFILFNPLEALCCCGEGQCFYDGTCSADCHLKATCALNVIFVSSVIINNSNSNYRLTTFVKVAVCWISPDISVLCSDGY